MFVPQFDTPRYTPIQRQGKTTVLYILIFTGVPISPYPDQEGNKLMFLSECREFPSAPCLAERKKKLDDSSRLDVVEIARVPDMLPSLFPSWSG